MQFHVRMAQTDYFIRTAEQTRIIKERLESLKQAVKIANDALEFAKRKKYKSLYPAAQRRIEYLEKRIVQSPIVAMETEMSSSLSDTPTEIASNQSDALEQMSDLNLNWLFTHSKLHIQ